MLSVWRFVSPQYASTAFSGEGARLYGGRWNSKGKPVVYTASTQALGLLEMTVQNGPVNPKYAVIEAIIPDDLEILMIRPEDLPESWRGYDNNFELRAIGDAWFTSGESAVLGVPSAVIPAEYNYLLNPEHPDFKKIQIGEAREFTTDGRLIRPAN